MSNFYAGVRVFEPLSTKVGLHVDQFNFCLCMFVACLLGRQFQTKYSIKRISADQRHMFAFLSGFTLALFCFRHQVMHLFILSSVTYAMISCMKYSHCRYLVLAFNLVYLACTHLARQYWDYGGYTMDITGPMMIIIQKLSMIAFNLYDGECIRDKKPLDFENAVKHAVMSHPTPLQFFSYVINFQTGMIGPFIFYTDYLKYIEGREREHAETMAQKQYFDKNRTRILAAEDMVKKYIISLVICGALHKCVTPFFPLTFYMTEEFSNFSFANKIVYLLFTGPMMRQQYYFAWSLTSLCCLCSGLGFSGFVQDTLQPDYSIIENFNLKDTESPTNMNCIIAGWNKTANVWLREAIYYRVPRHIATPCVFMCSAVWHGFYPGYYLFFITGGIYLQVSRLVRRKIRPYFLVNLGNNHHSSLYDVVTVTVTTFSIQYMAVPFVMLEFSKAIQFWSQFYFCGHLGAICILIFVWMLPYFERHLRHRTMNHNGNT